MAYKVYIVQLQLQSRNYRTLSNEHSPEEMSVHLLSLYCVLLITVGLQVYTAKGTIKVLITVYFRNVSYSTFVIVVPCSIAARHGLQGVVQLQVLIIIHFPIHINFRPSTFTRREVCTCYRCTMFY